MKTFLVEALDTGYFDNTLKYAGDTFPCAEDKFSKTWMRKVKELASAEEGSAETVSTPPAAVTVIKTMNGAPVVDRLVKGGLGEPGAPQVGGAAPLAPPPAATAVQASPGASSKPEEAAATGQEGAGGPPPAPAGSDVL